MNYIGANGKRRPSKGNASAPLMSVKKSSLGAPAKADGRSFRSDKSGITDTKALKPPEYEALLYKLRSPPV